MRVLLLNPPCADGRRYVREGRCTHPTSFWGTAWPPYTLAMLGARLRMRGHVARLLDAAVGDVKWADLPEVVTAFRPDAAIVAVSAPTFPSDIEAIDRIRRCAPACRIGVIGVHPTAEPDRYLSGDQCADFAVRGEPELTVDAAIGDDSSISPAPGLSVRAGNRIIHGPDRPVELDVSSLGRPDWDLVNVGRYRMPFSRRPFLPVLTSRGCPHSCTFCAQRLYYGSSVRTRRPIDIAEEIEELRGRFGVRDFFLWSECFSADREHAFAVCEALRRLKGISWVATTRADCVDPGLLREMRSAGCRLVGFGFESGSQAILDACRKGHSVEDSIRAAKWAREAGLLVLGHFVFGLPGETDVTARATLDMALAMGVDFAQFYCAAPYPGTELYDSWRASDGTSRTVITQERACMATEALTQRQIDRWRRRAYLRFYARPRAALLPARVALRIRSSSQVVARPSDVRKAGEACE
ncbi:MAG: radical SAM protein [Armatimonadota bacterium]|nr:radical SAM protein [Armatimonadota bacterium]